MFTLVIASNSATLMCAHFSIHLQDHTNSQTARVAPHFFTIAGRCLPCSSHRITHLQSLHHFQQTAACFVVNFVFSCHAIATPFYITASNMKPASHRIMSHQFTINVKSSHCVIDWSSISGTSFLRHHCIPLPISPFSCNPENFCNNGNTCVKGPCMLESLRTTMSYKSVFFGTLSGSIVCASTGQYARRSRRRF